MVALKHATTLTFDGHQVIANPPGVPLVSAVGMIRGAVDASKHKALDSAVAAAKEAAACVVGKPGETLDGTTVNPKLAAHFDAVVKALEAAAVPGLQLNDLQAKPPALRTETTRGTRS